MCVIIDRLSTFKCVLVIVSHIKWVSDFLFEPFYDSDKIRLPEIIFNYDDELGSKSYDKRSRGGDDDDTECSICLCQLEDGDEVRELKCRHFFHRVCLDRWLGHGRLTCPLCRGHLRLEVPGAGVNSGETLFFNFCDVGGLRQRDKWWLR